MRVVFLDRDGVINENRADHVKSWDEFRFIPGVLSALQLLRQADFQVFVVTNQAAIARGQLPDPTLRDIHVRMVNQIQLHGGQIHDIRYCPHDPGDGCQCRKPQPGMLLDLATAWQVDLSQSYLIGDAWTDIAAGRAAACRCVMVRTGRGSEHMHLPQTRQHPADHTAADLLSAVAWLFTQEDLRLPWPDAPLWWRRQARRERSTALSLAG